MPEFRLHRDASIPILVHDVDADGDSDLIWGRGHNIGLYWLEQIREGSTRRWQFHAIDTSWSSAHAPILADLDGDGRQDLVAGKRFLGHDGRDPGEFDPLVVYWYRFDPLRRGWQRHPVSWGAGCGFDLDPKCVDLDADGDVDILAPTRAGLYWLENLGWGPIDSAPRTMFPPELPERESPAPLLVVTDPPTGERRIRDGLDWGFRREQILRQLEQVMGPFPLTERRTPLAVEYVSRTETKHYVRHRIVYESEPGDRVPAYLLIPHDCAQPTAAVLCLHPTSPLGKDQICGLGGEPSRFYAHELAEQGYVCLAPDYPSFGEYAYDFSTAPGAYVSGTMKAIWNNVRAVDLLESLDQVDRDRIACMGHSLGGHNGLFTAVFDQRIRAIVTNCGFNAFEDYAGGDLTGWSSARYMPRIRTEFGADYHRMPFDFHEVIAALAPRPVFISAPLHDDNFPVEGVRKVIDRVQPVYDLLDATDRLHVIYPDAGHDFPDDVRQQAYDWLKRVLAKRLGG
jgi:dienelactone hydrolase